MLMLLLIVAYFVYFDPWVASLLTINTVGSMAVAYYFAFRNGNPKSRFEWIMGSYVFILLAGGVAL